MVNRIFFKFATRQKKILKLIFCLSILAVALLNGCSTTKRDGPPSYYVDVSRIPDAVPKAEHLSRIGNKPYTVFGKKYYVMSSSKNYEERGVASWYGTQFHGHHTSNGERYNMLAMTAAHKTLPLPTYVEVTNLKNGRKIIVKVTDRGPFENNRLIDLSYVAAKKLGMLGHGTAPVNVKAIDPLQYDKNNYDNHSFFLAKINKAGTYTSSNTTSTKQFATTTRFEKKFVTRKQITVAHRTIHPTYIRVGAFRSRIYAEKLKKRLTPVVGSPVNITQLTHLGKLYRVQIGPVHDAIRFAQINRQLRLMGIKGIA